MPQVIVIADSVEGGDPPVMLRERVSGSDFESPHFAGQLVERIGWAVGDAEELSRRNQRAAEWRARRRMAETQQRDPAVSGRPVRPVS